MGPQLIPCLFWNNEEKKALMVWVTDNNKTDEKKTLILNKAFLGVVKFKHQQNVDWTKRFCKQYN